MTEATKDPTPEQLAAAIAAGWNPDDGEPPDGWDAHAPAPAIDPALGHNGIAPTDAEQIA